MRGESSDVIEGEAVESSEGDIGKSTNATHSPPLSAAASQVSLASSDLTTSDPDLALTSSASSVTSSRPPSSSDVISPDLGLPSVDDYTTETDNLTTQSKPVRSIMAGSGASFMNELNSALRKRSHEPRIDQKKSDEPCEIGDTDVSSDIIDSGVIGSDYRDPSSSLPLFLGAIPDAKSLSLEEKTQGVIPKYESEKIPKLDFEPEVGMIVLNHQAAKHKLSVKPKRKHEGQRPRKRFLVHGENISEPNVDDSSSKTLQQQDITSPVMPTSLLPKISPQNPIVDCPQSPLPQTEEGVKTGGVCFAPDIKILNEEAIQSIPDRNNDFSTEFDPGTNLLGVPPEDGPSFLGPPEGPPSLGFDVEMEDEDYFEEFHLPNSQDNAFVRHKSFRRRVNLAPIDAPDAERIEGLISAGEFERHGSIRRKLVPEDLSEGNKHHKLEKQLSDISSKSGSDAEESISTDVSGVFARDMKEIQEMLDEESMVNIEGDVAPYTYNVVSINDTKELSDENRNVNNSDAQGDSEIHSSPIISENTDIPITDTNSKQAIHRTNTSTPKTNSTSSYTSAMLDKDLSSMSEGDSQMIKGEPFLSFEEESMSLDHSTLMKIQECRDFSRLKDVYNLTGRIQDILSPEEMKEVLEHADRYKKYINEDILEALNHSLSLSLQEKTTETNTDSGIGSPKRTANEIKSDLRSIFEDSIETIDEASENESKEHNNNNDDEYNDTGFVFERKRSLRIVNGNSDNEADVVEVEAVFVESDNSPRNMKRLAAPALDFSATGSEDLEGSHDISVFSNDTPISELDIAYIPNIVLTNTDGYRGDIKQDNDSCSNLLLYDTPSAASEVLTPLDLGSYSYTQTPEQDRPGSIDLNGECGQRKLISVSKDILNSPADGDDISISSVCSDDILQDQSLGSIADEISETPGGDVFGINSPRLSSQGSDGCQHSSPESQSFEEPPLPPSPYKTCEEDPIPSLPPFIPELSALEESLEDRHWRSVVVGGVWRRIDMKVIAPYRKCLHHGGYMSENNQAIIVFSSCYLPNSSRRDYNYVMDNLFLYVLSTLEQLVADDYVLIYLAGGCPKNSVPSFKWLKRAYQMIDHKLRKNLQALHVVHPTMWVKTIVALTRPFVSSKFYRKLSFINNLTELAQVVPLDQLEIPDTVQQADFELMIREKKKNMGRYQGGSITSPHKDPLSPSSAMSPTRGFWSPVR